MRAVAAVAVLGALLTAEAALAQSGGTQTGPVAEPLIIVERSDQVVEFGPRTITGKVAVPGGALVRVRPPGSRRQLIGLRSNFRAQLRQTVDAL